MKLAFTVCDSEDLMHAGGEPTRTTYVVDVPDADIPFGVRKFLQERAESMERQRNGGIGWHFKSMSISIVAEAEGGE